MSDTFPDERKQLIKKAYSQLSWAFLVIVLVSNLVAGLIIGFREAYTEAKNMEQEVSESNTPLLIYSCIGLYIAFIFFHLMTRKMENHNKEKINELSPAEFLFWLVLTLASMYLFNLVSVAVNYIIARIKNIDLDSLNPLINIVQDQSPVTLIVFVCILQPFLEEVIFRGIILNKTRQYGEKNAIVYSAIFFGLLHGNLSQFFYAVALGLLWGYIAVRTNSIRYTIVLHIITNFVGLLPTMSGNENPILMTIVFVFMISIITIGIILFIRNIKNVKLSSANGIEKAEMRKLVYLNPGTIIALIILVANLILTVMLL